MMEYWRFFSRSALGVATGLVLASVGSAQTVPAEQPPASFTGAQYVDSAGCMFVRAGVAGAVEWVPQVGRDRRHICGQTPSLSGRSAAAAPTPRTAPAASEGIVIIGGTGSGTRTPAAAPPRPTPTTTTAAETRPTVTVAAPAPALRVQTPVASSTVRVGAPSAGCGGANAQYFYGAGARCAPQAIHPSAGSGVGAGVGQVPVGVSGGAVAGAGLTQPQIPEGYRSAYDDGRLNPLRGVGTAQGAAQMAMVWTDTVPRRLVYAETGLPVLGGGVAAPGTTAFRSVAIPPNADGVSVSVSSMSRVVTPRARSVEPGAAPRPSVSAGGDAVRVSSEHRHVLAATYPSRADADRAYAQLAATGLPMRLGQINRTTGMVYAVVAGPFASTDDLVAGLRATQAAGFAGAVTRR